MKVSMTVNGQQVSGDVEPRTLLVHFIREELALNRHSCGLRDVLLRSLHDSS